MSAAHRVSSTSVTSQKSTTGLFRVVQIDGLVALKIIKHFEQSGGLTSATPVQGVLLGLMDNETLEITNCFPFPADEDADVSEYQREMIKKLRKINVDQLTVGFYQSSVYGFFITRELIEDMYVYQTSVEESVCLIYDPMKTTNGAVGLKAYRLKSKFFKNYGDSEITNETLQKMKLNYEEVLEEMPIKYHNSYLTQCFVAELGDKYPLQRNENLLKLGSGFGLEKNLRLLSEHVDRMSAESSKHANYYKGLIKQQQLRQQHQYKKEQENLLREKRGEPPLPQEDLDKMFKLPTPPPRLDNVLLSAQVQSFCRELQDSTASSMCKAFLAEVFQPSTQDDAN
ncbi:eukaryotic translation initiation factor 3 subunit H-B-like [Symsagittifera roscoffensis]|uniref:eukaryotic translation initiation factor 3 subunit H-B-like n=1 Tax=Symsagittifera roscoffensis TaxID=84072 RepID=UPI00307B3500